MKIKITDYNIEQLTIDDVSTIISAIDSCQYDVKYQYLNQSANAKSLINLLAIDICNEPFGSFIFDKRESTSNIEKVKKCLAKFSG